MEQKQANIAIKKIKEIEFFVNEAIELEDPALFNIGFELTINVTLLHNTIKMVLPTIFAVSNRNNVFMRIKTSNVFLFLELADFRKSESDEFDIPDNVMVTLLSLSISHSRALLAKNSLGTKFAELYIPIVNPSEILKQLFGKQ